MAEDREKKEAYTLEEFGRDFRKCVSAVRNGYIFAETTEEIVFCCADSRADEERTAETVEKLFSQGLEIRIFDEESEAKWFRASVEKQFRFRERRDVKNSKKETDGLLWWDESQYLDVDTKRTQKARLQGRISPGTVYATGGGEYPLPIEDYENVKIRIRNYLGKDTDTGELYAADWRLAGFGEWPDSGKGGRA